VEGARSRRVFVLLLPQHTAVPVVPGAAGLEGTSGCPIQAITRLLGSYKVHVGTCTSVVQAVTCDPGTRCSCA
jgi:hypothetical protein